MSRWVIVLLAVSVALVAASARAGSEQVVLAPTVFATHGLPANAITAFAVTCSPGYVAASAGISTPAPGTTLLSIAPLGRRGYRFRFGNPVANGDQRVTVAVACRKLTVVAGRPGLALKLKPLKEKYVVVPARKTAAATLVCPPGTAPAGAGVDVDPGRQQAVGAYRASLRLSVRRQTQTLQRFTFALANDGTQARRVAVYGACVTLERAAGAPNERLHVQVTTFRVPVRPGSQTFGRRCRSGWFSLAAGYALRSKPTTGAGATAVGRGGRWAIVSDAAAGTQADLQLACARLAP